MTNADSQATVKTKNIQNSLENFISPQIIKEGAKRIAHCRIAGDHDFTKWKSSPRTYLKIIRVTSGYNNIRSCKICYLNESKVTLYPLEEN